MTANARLFAYNHREFKLTFILGTDLFIATLEKFYA